MKRIVSVFVVGILLVSCASTIQFAKFTPIEKVSKGKAKICVIRKKTGFASGIKSKIYQDERFIGKLGYASFLSWESDPKTSYIVATTENRDSVKIDLQKDKTYYIRLDYKMGFLMGRADLKMIEKEEFQQLLRNVKKPKITNY